MGTSFNPRCDALLNWSSHSQNQILLEGRSVDLSWGTRAAHDGCELPPNLACEVRIMDFKGA